LKSKSSSGHRLNYQAIFGNGQLFAQEQHSILTRRFAETKLPKTEKATESVTTHQTATQEETKSDLERKLNQPPQACYDSAEMEHMPSLIQLIHLVPNNFCIPLHY
jgi:hypothetical protein